VPKPTPIDPDLALTAIARIRVVNWIYAEVSTLLVNPFTRERSLVRTQPRPSRQVDADRLCFRRNAGTGVSKESAAYRDR
jgi:hypothetical protein